MSAVIEQFEVKSESGRTYIVSRSLGSEAVVWQCGWKGWTMLHTPRRDCKAHHLREALQCWRRYSFWCPKDHPHFKDPNEAIRCVLEAMRDTMKSLNPVPPVEEVPQ